MFEQTGVKRQSLVGERSAVPSRLLVLLAAVAMVLAACTTASDDPTTTEAEQDPVTTSAAPDQTTAAPDETTAPDEPPASAVDAVVAYDEAGVAPNTAYRFAYIVECANENAYCSTRIDAMDVAAEKYGGSHIRCSIRSSIQRHS